MVASRLEVSCEEEVGSAVVLRTSATDKVETRTLDNEDCN
jgi:hypothetical protein